MASEKCVCSLFLESSDWHLIFTAFHLFGNGSVFAVFLQKGRHKFKISVFGIDLVLIQQLIHMDGVPLSAYTDELHIFEYGSAGTL